MKIPLNKPYWGTQEQAAIVRALKTGTGVGDGPHTHKATEKLKKITGSAFAYLVTSCTSAMDIMLMAKELKRGDEIIVPSFTLSSTATAVVMAGGTPVFADIDPLTYCIDPFDIERCITKRTRGILLVHYAGMPAPMEKIMRIAKKYKLFVMEDAAHAIGAYYYNKHLGTLADAGAFSFHGTKNIASGEGGAIVTNDRKLSDRIDILRAIGTNRSDFLAGKVSLYEWVGRGSSYVLSDLLASLLSPQFDRLKTVTALRTKIALAYTKAFAPFSQVVQLPVVPPGAHPNWHIYALRFYTKENRKEFQAAMRKEGIEVSGHYVPLHSSVMGKKLGGTKRALPVTDDVAGTLVRLPIYPGLSIKQQAHVISVATRILKRLS